MDTRLELIDNLRIGIELEMGAIIEIGGISIEEYRAVTQNYLMLKIVDNLEQINKTLNLISVQTSMIAMKAEKQHETDAN